MSPTLSLSTILQKTQNPLISSFLPTNPLSLSPLRSLHFPPLTLKNLVKSYISPHFSSQPLYAAAETPSEEEEESAIGDCLVYEEGIFDDPNLQTTRNFRNDESRVRKRTNKDTNISPENLIPEQWLDIQRELNITKKERRKLSQKLEYGRRVEKKRQALMPLNSEKYERFKNEKLKQLKPVVLDKLEPKYVDENDEDDEDERRGEEIRGRVAPRNPRLEYGRRVEKKRQALMPLNSEKYEKFKNEKLKQLKPVVLDKLETKYVDEIDEDDEDERRGEEIRGRVAPRNPRLAVYGGGLEDISAHFSSGNYDPGAADKSQGPRKLFSKEEKLLMNKRVPDLAIATSGKWHPLHTLAASGEFYLVNSLLKLSLDINATDKDGLTAIHKAILGKKQAIFNFLLRESANPFVRDSEGATLVHYAVFIASSQMIKILLLYNVDINLQDNDGWTPLHLAVQSRRTDIVRLLLIKGADQNLKNRDGLTALDLCLYSGRDTRTYELIKLLKRFS